MKVWMGAPCPFTDCNLRLLTPSVPAASPRSAMVKPLIQLLLALGLCTILTSLGCKKETEAVIQEPSRPIRVMIATPETHPIQLHYVGLTNSESIRRYAFKVGGKIDRIFVKKGESIKKGQALARLDQRDYATAVRAARLQHSQAKEAAREAKRTFESVSSLYEEGARPQNDLEQARLGSEIRKSSQAQALLDLKYKLRTLDSTTLTSEVDGFVVDVLSKEGELAGVGYPIVVVRGQQQVVKVGVSQSDIKRLAIGTKATVEVDGIIGTGEVSNIGQMPDQTSRTYNVDVVLTGPLGEKDFYLGSIAKVAFEVGTSEGIWVPVPSVLTAGLNYVFVVEGERAVRKNIDLGPLSGSKVMVKGLDDGDQVIVEGMKNLRDGYKVEVVQ